MVFVVASLNRCCLGISRHRSILSVWWNDGLVTHSTFTKSFLSTTISKDSSPVVEKLVTPDEPFPQSGKSIADMTNDELQDTSTIPGFDLIHSPPRTFPRGALVGTVVSDKMQKTINVAVVRHRIVPKIRKRLKYTRKFMAHDEREVARMGDTVMITPCHKITKNKHFMLREIIRPKGQLY